jgi:hypothetical protein
MFFTAYCIGENQANTRVFVYTPGRRWLEQVCMTNLPESSKELKYVITMISQQIIFQTKTLIPYKKLV